MENAADEREPKKGSRSDYYREWRNKNPEKAEKARRDRLRWAAEHRGRMNASARKTRLKNKTNPEWLEKLRTRERIRNKTEASRKYNRERLSRLRRDHPEVIAAYNHKRRASKRSAGGIFTAREWLELCAKYDNKCLACGRSDVKLTADHVIPLVNRGSNDIGNIQPLCLSCNCSKATKSTDYRPGQ